MKDALTRQEFEAYAALLASSTLLQRAVERNLQEQAGITQVQFEILMQLCTVPEGLRMADLADRLIVSRSGLTYQVTQLEQSGLIARERHENDERGVVARITPAGESLRQRVLGGHLALVRSVFLERLQPGEVETITVALTRIADGMR